MEGLRRLFISGAWKESVDFPACITLPSGHSDFIHKFRNQFSVQDQSRRNHQCRLAEGSVVDGVDSVQQ